uniref:Lipocalin n=1 Tax=Rhipicephalus appendiculatus TaxID=34631 RepID=A0A131YR97_RHIAP
MNYWVLTFLLGTYGVTCVEILSHPSLQDLRAFLNTTRTIYLYSSSHRNIFWDHPGFDEECTQYHPIWYGSGYFFNTSYMLNCTWTSRPLNAWLKEDTHGKRPYLSQAIEHGGTHYTNYTSCQIIIEVSCATVGDVRAQSST